MDCAHYNNEDYRQHDRVFGYILAVLRSQTIQVKSSPVLSGEIRWLNLYTFLTRPKWPVRGNPKVTEIVLLPSGEWIAPINRQGE
jgi:hypothetical protein